MIAQVGGILVIVAAVFPLPLVAQFPARRNKT